jgi:hypothetical protein
MQQHHLHIIRHWILSRKRNEPDSSTEERRPRRKNKVFRRLDAWGSIFGDDILQNPNIQNPNHPDGIKFRRRFRVPYSIFMSIVGMFRSREGWNPANSTDPRAHAAHPLEIKILSALFILGRGVDIDTVSMLSRISTVVLLSFFHHFCEKMSSLYEEYIYMPQGDDLLRVTEKYASMGFPGCVGSTDCVHFFWDRCPHNVRFLHSGKEGKPTVAYSMIVDHMRRIRSVTAGHPGARNDKSISQYDKSQQDMRTGRLYRDETFTLFEAFGQEGQMLECE